MVNCGRYDQCITKFDKETGYLAAPKKNDLMYDNARGSYMVYTGKKWKDPSHYDLMINTSHIDIEEACNLIKRIYEKM